jgi:hypothetical protein
MGDRDQGYIGSSHQFRANRDGSMGGQFLLQRARDFIWIGGLGRRPLTCLVGIL